jgi:molybdopterin-binding protein
VPKGDQRIVGRRQLGLEPGMLAIAAFKATNVSIEIPHS